MLDKESESERGEGQSEREKSKLPTEWGGQRGVKSQDPEIITPVEIKSRTLSRLSHPDTP